MWLQQAESGGGCRFHAQWWDQAVSNLLPFPSPDAASVQGRQLLAGLEKVHSDLDKLEKAITANLRPPLEQSRAVQDSTERSKDLKVQGHRSRLIAPHRDPDPKAEVLPRGLQCGSWCAGCCWCSQSSMKAGAALPPASDQTKIPTLAVQGATSPCAQLSICSARIPCSNSPLPSPPSDP